MKCQRWLVLVAGVAFGCGEMRTAPMANDAVRMDQDGVAAGKVKEAAAPEQRAPAGGAPQAAAKAEQPVARKIIYTAQVDVVVDDFDEGESALKQMLKESDGYVAKAEVRGTPGTPRSATWTLRVPVARFDDFLAAVGQLGELRRSSLDSKDITDAYYDLQAHVKNDETREEGLRKLYTDKAKVETSKLEDLLAIDRELSGVRGKIDAQKGQLQRWDKETALSTATITMQDRKDYIAPMAPTFGGAIGRTFQRSVDSLVAAGKTVVLAAVALAPWLPVLALAVAPFWIALRRRRRSVAISDVVPVVEPAPPT